MNWAVLAALVLVGAFVLTSISAPAPKPEAAASRARGPTFPPLRVIWTPLGYIPAPPGIPVGEEVTLPEFGGLYVERASTIIAAEMAGIGPALGLGISIGGSVGTGIGTNVAGPLGGFIGFLSGIGIGAFAGAFTGASVGLLAGDAANYEQVRKEHPDALLLEEP